LELRDPRKSPRRWPLVVIAVVLVAAVLLVVLIFVASNTLTPA
jgi:hypothetical protein